MLAAGEGSSELNGVLGRLWSKSHLVCKYLSWGKDILLCPIFLKVNRGAAIECCSSPQQGRTRRLHVGEKTHTGGRTSPSPGASVELDRPSKGIHKQRDKTGISEEQSKTTPSSSIQIPEWESKERVQVL